VGQRRTKDSKADSGNNRNQSSNHQNPCSHQKGKREKPPDPPENLGNLLAKIVKRFVPFLNSVFKAFPEHRQGNKLYYLISHLMCLSLSLTGLRSDFFLRWEHFQHKSFLSSYGLLSFFWFFLRLDLFILFIINCFSRLFLYQLFLPVILYGSKMLFSCDGKIVRAVIV